MFKQVTSSKSIVLLTLASSAIFLNSSFATVLANDGREFEETAASSEPRAYVKEAINYFNAAVAFDQQGLLQKSITEYKLALEADPRIVEAYNNLGVIYCSQLKFDQAIESYQNGLLINPRNVQLLDGLATTLYISKKIDEAITRWRQLIEMAPNYKPAQDKLEVALKKKGSLPGDPKSRFRYDTNLTPTGDRNNTTAH